MWISTDEKTVEKRWEELRVPELLLGEARGEVPTYQEHPFRFREKKN